MAYNDEILFGLILKMIYPVGSIYYTTNKNFNPANYFGGTWTRIKGRFIVGVDENDMYYHDSALTGGIDEVTLDISNIPSHTHTYPARMSGDANYGSGAFVVDTWAYQGKTGSDLRVGSTGSTGGDSGITQPHENRPPYYTAYIWRRTA